MQRFKKPSSKIQYHRIKNGRAVLFPSFQDSFKAIVLLNKVPWLKLTGSNPKRRLNKIKGAMEIVIELWRSHLIKSLRKMLSRKQEASLLTP